MTTYSDITPRTNLYAASQMLEHALPHLVLEKFADHKQMPKKKTQTIKFRRPNTFNAATTPLVEGVTPTATTFGYTDVSVQLKQYGEVVKHTDVIMDTHEDPVLQDMTMMSGENIGRTIEQLNYGVTKAGTSVYYANGASRSAVNTPISLSKLRAAVRYLKAQKAKPITRVLDGSEDYATRPVEAAYVAICHTDCDADVRNLTGFTPVAEYGNRKPIHENECGSVENVRFIMSADLDPFADAGGAKGSMVSTTGTSADVYPILLFGQHAWATVALRGEEAIEPTVISANKKDKADPLGQVGYVGWKIWHASLILNDAWMTRLEVAVTDL